MQPSAQKLIHTFAALADLGQEIANPGDFKDMVRTSLHLLLGTLAIRRGAVTEFVDSQEHLECIAVWGIGKECGFSLAVGSPEREAFVEGHSLDLGAEQQNGLFAGFIGRHGAELRREAIELVSPMVVRGKLVGLVLLGAKASGEPFTSADLEVVGAMVRHIGVGINGNRLLAQVEQRAEENRRLYEDLRGIYRDTVRAFAAAIDIKDKYTQGHSERVGKYSEIIARELGWDDEQAEGMAIAGYLHDIGKLVVERDIINAPYKIDAKASTELNRHPTAGYEILAPIRHPYADIPLMARYHHERLDGTGYPDGLSGDQIPLGAKIVALADSFDAMTTDRPYKRRCSFCDVVDDFRRNTGTQFDPQVVTALCRALLKEITGETRERRFLKMLGKDYLKAEEAIPMLQQLVTELDTQRQSVAAGGGPG